MLISHLALLVPLLSQDSGTVARRVRAPRDVSDRLAALLVRHDVPGIGAASIQGDKVTAIGVSGVVQRGLEVDVELTDPWHLGSCTKAMTATLVALAVDDGELDWESTLGDVFAGERKLHKGWEDVSVKDLLQHRGGAPHDLTSYFGLGLAVHAVSDDARKQRRLLVDGLLEHGPSIEPGLRYVYSNNGYVLANAMLEELLGKAFEESIQERLFGPLGITSAGFGPPRPMGEVPVGHDKNGDPVGTSANADNPPAYGPAGTVHMNLEDWCRFAMLHLAGARGESEFLSSESFDQLHTPNPESQTPYAMGWMEFRRPWAGESQRVLYHNGTNTMWYAVIWIAPDVNRAYVAVTNRGAPEGEKACDAAVSGLIMGDLASDRSR